MGRLSGKDDLPRSGRTYRRNRRFIRPYKLPHTETLNDPDPTDKPESPPRRNPKRTRSSRRHPAPSTVPPRRSARLAKQPVRRLANSPSPTFTEARQYSELEGGCNDRDS